MTKDVILIELLTIKAWGGGAEDVKKYIEMVTKVI